MLTRLTSCVLVGLFVASLLAVDAAEGKKKKGKDRTGPVGAQDGKDDVNGAMWHVAAENTKTGKKEQFKFRVKDGDLFDTTGKKIGVVSSIATVTSDEVKSKLVWRESVPLLGTFVITQVKKGVWGGTLKTKEGDEWKCRIEVLDR